MIEEMRREVMKKMRRGVIKDKRREVTTDTIREVLKDNQSPKGNMWSAIPFVLVCMIVSLSERKQGSGPEGDEVL